VTKKHKKSPAFQFYPNDFMGSPTVAAMTAAEVGAYLLLLCADWNGDGFAWDVEELARTCKMTDAEFKTAWRRVSRCFVERRGRFFNPRLDAERKKQREWRRKSSEGGKLSAAKRSKGGSRVVQPPHQPNGNTPFPSPTPKQQLHTGRVNPDGDPLFAEAWAEYPKRPGNSRVEAYRQWLARVKDGVDPIAMLEGTRNYARHLKVNPPEDPRFIKQAQTFYGRGRHFEADWNPATDDRVMALVEEEDAAIERTRQLLAKRGAA
jgi:uncharacterized protein YdaU (DUF1376 family)